jgi:hypothetical protein
MKSGVLKPLMLRTRGLLALLFVGLFLTGCTSLVRTEQSGVTEGIKLSAGETVGQTFVARYDGLQEISFFLSPSVDGNGELRVYLRSDPQSEENLVVSTNSLAIVDVDAPGFYHFVFPIQVDSNQSYYYAVLEVTGGGELSVGGGSGNTYLDGAEYQNGSPLEAQAAFQLGYAPGSAILGLGNELLRWAGYLVIGAFLFLLPGWGLFSVCFEAWRRFSWPEKLGLSAGLSLGLYPLLFLWTDVIGVHMGALYAWLPALTGLGMILWRNRKNILERIALRKVKAAIASTYGRRTDWQNLLVLGVLVLIFAVRYWVIRSLEVPQWGDSVQHTVMAQLMLENGGLFRSWEPYAHYSSLTVQYGFSGFIALFAWISGQSSSKATLIGGQIINGLAVLALYPLAVRIARGNRWAGIGAVVVAGLLSPMPAFYVNWGRYAQLSGQAVLPVALWLVWEAMEHISTRTVSGFKGIAKGSGRLVVLAGLSLTGMTLCYYRMPFYYVTFILILLIGWGLPIIHLNWVGWLRVGVSLLAVGGLAVILFIPWVPRLFGSNLAGALEAGMTSGSSLADVQADFQNWRFVYFYVPKLLAWTALAGICWSLIKRCWLVAFQGLWIILLSGIIAGSLIHLPGANMIQTFAIHIALYIPTGIVVGWLIGEIACWVTGHKMESVAVAAITLLAMYGAWTQRYIPEPSTFVLVARPDVRAVTWIRENTLAEDNFLVEGYSIYSGTSIVGSDAGWWLPLLAHRQTNMPPQYALMNEASNESGYTQRLIDLLNRLETTSLDSQDGVSLLCEQGITHLYIGQRQGVVGFDSSCLFPADTLRDSQYYRLLYHQDRVYIFSLVEGVCP